MPSPTPSATPLPVPNLRSTSNADTLILLILALLIIPSIAISIGFKIGGIYYLTKLHYYRRSKARNRQNKSDTLREEIELDVLNVVDGKASTWDDESDSVDLKRPENAMMAPKRGEGRTTVKGLRGLGVVEKGKGKAVVKEKWDRTCKGKVSVRGPVVDENGLDEVLIPEHVFEQTEKKKVSERFWASEMARWAGNPYQWGWQNEEPESSRAQDVFWDAVLDSMDQEEEFGERVVERGMV